MRKRAAARTPPPVSKQNKSLAKQLWGPASLDGTTYANELHRLRAINETLEKQRDDALEELNNQANIDVMITRLATARRSVEEIALALIATAGRIQATMTRGRKRR